MSEALSPRDAVKTLDTWEILGAPYLDTSHDAPWSAAFAEELRSRGIIGWRGVSHRLLAFGGYWWNFLLWWEWASLGKRNLVWGWVLNGVLLVSIVLGSLFNWIAGIVAFVALQWFIWPFIRKRYET